MRFANVMVIAGLLLFLAAIGFFLLQHEGPWGMAVSTFSASVTVYNGVIPGNTTQLGVPVVDGQSVFFETNYTYAGVGIANITIPAPAGFPNGYNWSVNESGNILPVSASGGNITWEANFSAGGATLLFYTLAPYIVVISISVGDTAYAKTVQVIADNHFINVTTTIPVDSKYHSFVLTENGADVSQVYGFNVTSNATAAMAHWTGFNLSTKTFAITGVKESSTATGRRRVSFAEKNATNSIAAVDEGGAFLLSPSAMDISVQEDLWTTASVSITNEDNRTRQFTLRATNDIMSVEPTLTLAAGETKAVAVRIIGLPPSEHASRLVVSDGRITHDTFFRITSTAILSYPAGNPSAKQPAVEQPAKLDSTSPIAGNLAQQLWIFSLVVIAVAAALIVWMRPRSD